jgi:hypothetical protein
MNKINYITSKIKNGMIFSFAFGFIEGLVPNNININFNNKKYNNLPLPFISGCFGLIRFVLSPILITNYCFNGVYFDKLIDKYDINFERHHQYDGKNNKYAFPSILILNIDPKK